MDKGIHIRDGITDDANALSALITRVLHISNLADYGEGNIARVASHFTPQAVRDMMGDRETIVAERGDIIVGTAGIGPAATHDGKSIRTFFVDPDLQGQGIGKALFTALMKRVTIGEAVTVRSSIAGEQFYATLGFAKVQDHWEGDERTIEMRLSATQWPTSPHCAASTAE